MNPPPEQPHVPAQAPSPKDRLDKLSKKELVEYTSLSGMVLTHAVSIYNAAYTILGGLVGAVIGKVAANRPSLGFAIGSSAIAGWTIATHVKGIFSEVKDLVGKDSTPSEQKDEKLKEFRHVLADMQKDQDNGPVKSFTSLLASQAANPGGLIGK